LIHFYKSFRRRMTENPSDDTDHNELVNYMETEEEWDNLAEITPSFKGRERLEDSDCAESNPDLRTRLTSLGQVYQYLDSGVLDDYLAELTDPPKTNFDLLFNCICTIRPLPPHIEQGKQTIQASALIPFLNDEKLHLSTIRTIYRQLTGSRFDCPRYGHHWEDIGFQGNDPATDLRGVGFLGVVQVLYLVTTPEVLPFAKDVYSLSRSQTQEFPLMVLSLNVTRIVLHLLRDGLLDKQCYKDDDAWCAVNSMYAAVLFNIYHVWKSQHKTISNSGFVLKDAEENARRHPDKLLTDFGAFLKENYSVGEKQSSREQIIRDTNHNN